MVSTCLHGTNSKGLKLETKTNASLQFALLHLSVAIGLWNYFRYCMPKFQDAEYLLYLSFCSAKMGILLMRDCFCFAVPSVVSNINNYAQTKITAKSAPYHFQEKWVIIILRVISFHLKCLWQQFLNSKMLNLLQQMSFQ